MRKGYSVRVILPRRILPCGASEGNDDSTNPVETSIYAFGLTGSRGRVVSTRLESRRGVAERRWPVPRPVAMPNEPAPSARNREGGLS